MIEAVFAIIPFFNNKQVTIGAVTIPHDKRIGHREHIVFGLPGGKLENDETDIQGLVRECFEEGWGGELKFFERPIYETIINETKCRWYLLDVDRSNPIMLKTYKEKHRLVYPLITNIECILDQGNPEAFNEMFKLINNNKYHSLYKYLHD